MYKIPPNESERIKTMNDDKTTIPAGFFKAGQTVHIKASGTFVNPEPKDPQLRVTLKIDGEECKALSIDTDKGVAYVFPTLPRDKFIRAMRRLDPNSIENRWIRWRSRYRNEN